MKTLYNNYFRNKSGDNPVIKSISKIPIFENLSDKELSEVARLIHQRTYKKNEAIFKKMHQQKGCML